MIKVKDLMSKYSEYEVDEEKLKEILIKPKPKPKTVWDLEKEDSYYYLNPIGTVCEDKWENHAYDTKLRNINNMFLTKEEAKFESERRKCEAIMLKYGTRNIESIFPISSYTYYISYDNIANKVKIACTCCIKNDYTYCINTGCIYFSSEEFAQKAIDEMGEDRIKKYIFNVK